jgi:hypothetical protein
VNTLKKQLTHVTSLRVSSLTPGSVDLILGSDFTGLAPISLATPQASAAATVQPLQTRSASASPGTATAQPSASASSSGVAGLAQSNGGITAAAACTADSSAFSGPLSP